MSITHFLQEIPSPIFRISADGHATHVINKKVQWELRG